MKLVMIAIGLGLLPCASDGPTHQNYSKSVRMLHGWTVHVDVRLEQGELGAKAIELVDAKLLDVERALPAKALAKLRTVAIWLSQDSAAGPGAVYHPSVDWLREHGFDPAKAKGLEIANATNFLAWSREQPAMVLHELAHAYHDQVLGYDDASVKQCFEKVRAAKTLESVLHWNGTREKAYALTNEQEFFAEMSEAWFATNDFFPFVRGEVIESFPDVAALMRTAWER